MRNFGSASPAAFESKGQLIFIGDEFYLSVVVGLMAVLLFGVSAYAGRSCVPHISQSGHIAGGVETDKPSIFFLDGV